MITKKPYILVANDDGIDSPGIYALTCAMKSLGDVVVVAPDRQQSAVGHALTVSSPLRVTKFNRDGHDFGYAVNGTPADCVKIAIASLLDRTPDLLVSGINHGQNTAVNVLYSGTVSAATEGMLVGIPSIAVSVTSHNINEDISVAAEYIKKIAAHVLEHGLPKGTLLNVNVPSIPGNQIKGLKVVPLSKTIWKDSYELRKDPFGNDYFWFAGDYNIIDKDPETDDIAILNGYISVTPIRFDLTDREHLGDFQSLEKL